MKTSPKTRPVIAAPDWLENREALLFSLIFVLGALLRFCNLGERQLWVDEIIRLQCFSHPTFRENLAEVMNIVAATPLDFMIQDFFVTLWGQSEFGVRFHAAFFGSLSLAMIYWLGKRFFSVPVSLLATLLFAVYPLHHRYSQEGGNYSLFCFLALSSYYCLSRTLESRGLRWWILFTLVEILILYTNYFGVVLLISQGTFLICLSSGPVRNTLKFPLCGSWLRALLFFVLCTGLAVASFLPWLFATLDKTVWNSPNIFSEHRLFLRIFKEISGSGYPLSLLLFLFFGTGLREILRTKRWAGLSLLLSWFLLPFPIILFLDWSRQYFFPIRQLLFTTPAFFLGLAVGVEQLPGLFLTQTTGKKIRAIIIVLIVALSVGTLYLHSGREQADWKGLAAYMKRTVKENDLVSAPHIDNVLGYYYPEIRERHLPPEQLLKPKAERSSLPRRELNLYLIESIYMTAEQRQTVRQVLMTQRSRPIHSLQGFKIHRLRWKRPD